MSKSGYTVIALAANGQARTAQATRGSFRLRPPAPRVTLQLRAPDGTYAGPIVLAERKRAQQEVRTAKRKVRQAKRTRKGLKKARKRLRKARRLLRRARNRAILGVRAGARLGRVRVRTGYAKLSKPVRKRWVDRSRSARARREVPIGAGSFGHVRSASGRATVPGDADQDGIPDVLDVDDDGDLVLDALDDSPAPRSAAVGPHPGNVCAPNPFCVNTNLFVPASATTNSHVGSGPEAIEQTLQRFGNVSIVILLGGPVELDCGGQLNPTPPPARTGGLGYCSSGGTGRTFGGLAFPDCCDGDGDGFGTMVPGFPPGPGQAMGINHFARTDQIGTGDPLIQHIATGGDVSQCPPPDGTASTSCATFISAVSFVFAAPPALGSYTPEGTNSTPVQYPITGPLTVRDGDGDGDVEATLTFFRSQRRPTPKEPGHGQPGAWMDIGGLAYGVHVDFVAGSPGMGRSCPQDAFSENDDELGPRPPAPSTPAGLADSAPDRPASTGDTFTFTLNITKCIGGATWPTGSDVGVSFRASKKGSLTDQSGVIFRRGP